MTPIPFTWNGEAMVPRPGFAKRADARRGDRPGGVRRGQEEGGVIPLERIEKLAAAVNLLLADRRKAAALSEKLATAEGARRNKLNVDLNWQAMHVARKEAVVHALAVDAGLADLRAPECYATRIARPSPWHDYEWQPQKPEALIEALIEAEARGAAS